MIKKSLPYFKKELAKVAGLPNLKSQIINPGLKAAANPFKSKLSSPIVNRVTTGGHPVGMK